MNTGSNYTFDCYINKIENVMFTFQYVSPLSELAVSKATGIDKISARALKLAAPVITDLLTNIFNYSIETQLLP